MVPATIDEHSRKFILLDNEHDFTLFKLVERKQIHQCGPRCKTNKHIGICKYEFPITIFVEQHVAQCRNPNLAKCGGEAQHLEKLGIWSPPGLPNV